MSRNLKHRRDATYAPKKGSKNSSNTDDEVSFDSDYSAVDLISDSDEDEPEVEEAEEQAIIESEEDEDTATTPQPFDDDQSSWAGLSMEDNAQLTDNNLLDSHSQSQDVFLDASTWEAAQGSDDDPERRVRFDLSSSDESDADDSFFPDIFLDQNSLDPSFRRTIENDRDKDNDDPFSDDGSYWDFNGEEDEVPAAVVESESEDSESTVGSSGYESR